MVLDAAAEAAERLDVGVGIMLAADRTVDPEIAVAQARIAAKRTERGVVSFGLANDEAIGPPEPFAEAFAIAKEAGLLSVPHAGELVGPESVRGALTTLAPDRLQHGVRAVEDPALVDELADAGIVLDVCPTSNLLLSVYPSIAEHPLPRLLDAGVQCSLNADDPLLFGPGMLQEYELVRRDLELDDTAFASHRPGLDRRFGRTGGVEGVGARRSIDAWAGYGRGVTPSAASISALIDVPPVAVKPPIRPPAASTRWQGTTIGNGLRPSACPTARAAPGEPAAWATSPYESVSPAGIVRTTS